MNPPTPTPTRIRRRRRALPLLLTFMLGIAAACGGDDGGSAGASPDTRPTGSDDVVIPEGTTIRIADQFGQEEIPLRESRALDGAPYEVTYGNFVGAPSVLQAFQAGEVDFGLLGDSSIIAPFVADQDLVVIAARQTETDGSDFGVVASAASGVEDPAGLAGKKIGFSAGTAVESYLYQFLDHYDLTVDDVTLVNLPSNASGQALQSGDIDAVASGGPILPTILDAAPDATVFAPVGVYSGIGWFVTTAKALADPGKAAALGDLLARRAISLDWVNENPDEWRRFYFVEAFGVSPEVAARLDVGTHELVPVEGEVVATAQRLADLFVAAGAVDEEVDISPIFDDRFTDVIVAAEG